MKKLIGVFIFIFFISNLNSVLASELRDKVGVDEKLGNKIPLNTMFFDSDGKEVILKDLISKPTVIDFAYYKCTGICTPLMTEVADVVNKIDLIAGKDYNIITISINPDELPKDAANKKAEMMNLVKTEIPDSAWRFLTGDSLSINELTKAVGFNYERQGDTFLHTGLLVFVSSDGKICRYLKPGFTDRGDFRILPFIFKMAIVEASKGEAIPVIDELSRYCFSYEPKNESYVFNWFKISGAGILLAVAAVFIFVVLKPKKKVKS